MLAVLCAYSNMMDFLNVKIEKDLRNNTNRRVNFETANMDKVITAAISQRLAIEKIKVTMGFESLSPELIELAKVRLEYPEAPLSELAKTLGISKSGVNHRIRRLMDIANSL